MRVDVMFTPVAMSSTEWHGKVVVVIDVLRASTTIATAIANGARAVIPCESAEEAVARSKAFERADVLLAGERRSAMIEGFELGNSPLEYTPAVVEGRTILLTTTNGTGALLAVQGAREVLIGSFVNFNSIAVRLRAAARDGADLVFLCAGHDKQFALEDAVCAGRFIRSLGRRVNDATLSDAASAALALERRFHNDLLSLFAAAAHGRRLADAGYGDDLTYCARMNTCSVVPLYLDRQVRRARRDRGT